MKIVYVLNKMVNLAGIERILSCKMNYLAEKTPHHIYFITYEQGSHPLSFQLNDGVTYLPINAPIPQREGVGLVKWITTYLVARRVFKQQFHQVLREIHPDIAKNKHFLLFEKLKYIFLAFQ